MTDQIKTILEKHGIQALNDEYMSVSIKKDFINAIIEICEMQKKQCAIELEHDFDPTQAKNIAEC